MTRSAVLICPGRGTYGKGELGTITPHFPDPVLLARFDALRAEAGQATVSQLDGATRYQLAVHSRGDNASALIYTASLGDRLSLAPDIELLAVTGNSMGFYSALACAGAVPPEHGFAIANTMGTLMQEALIGGQVVYPATGPDWRPDPARRAEILAAVARIGARPDHALHLSIDLGGMLVLAGNEAGLAAFGAAVPRLEDRFPLRLENHAAFHTPLQAPVAEKGGARLAGTLFGQPGIPLIDGRGAIWWPHATDPDALRDYTLGQQVTEPYDFARAVTVAAREFAPDLFIVARPGTTLGGSVAQALISIEWAGLTDRDSFKERQARDPILISMGLEDQRARVAAG